MAELDTEHVRMLDAGRQRVAYSSPLTSSCFASVASKKTQLLQHGNTFGLSFVATEKGFVTTKNDELEASCTDYTKRRQEAMDHGQKLTLEEIHELPVAKEVQLPSIAYWITLSPDEVTLAVAYGDSVALFEVAHIVEATSPAPFHTFHKLQAQEIAWCRDPSSERLAVLTLEKQVVVCTLEGARDAISTETDASSIAWSPSGEQIAVGLVDATIAIYARDSLQFVRSIAQPESCAEQQFETHHVNWAENDLILAGYHKYDEENEETSALACIFDNEECVELDEVVGFFDVEGRRHQYFSRFLPDWRMFFIACSLSADIELLVSDPESGEWQLWKPLEKYQARLPMNADDEESFPMGFAINLNSTTPVPVDEDAFPPVPIISSTNTEGLLVNFAFVDTTVNEVDFVKSPSPFDKKATRAVAETSSETPEIKAEEPVSPKKKVSHEYGQNDENEFAESDGESSDEEEERKEEQDKARTTFRTMASDGADYIASEQFPKLFKAMGSTYDEEEHASTVEHLEKDGKIYENDFVSWYVNWIFGDDDSDSDEDEAAPASSESKPAEMKSKEEIAAVFSKFTAKEGSWKCAVCMVSNGPDAMKCSACETANPAAPKVVAPVTAASATSAGSIGSGGFSFPVPTGGDSKPSSFSFGVAPAAGSDAGGASKSTGFSFGGASSTTGFSFSSNTASSGTDFNFGAAAALTAPAATSGFSFGVNAGGSPDAAATSKNAAAVDSSVKDTKPSSPKKTVSHEYGQNDENEFAESDGESSDEEEMRKEEEAQARVTFRTIASDGADYIASEQFPKLFKAMGATYDEEEHASTVEHLEKDGKIYENDFVSWYVNWIFGDDDSDSDEDEAAPASSESKPAEMKSKEEIAAVFSKFTAKEGSWKCAVCMVSNGPDAMKCSACETANPAAPKVVAPVTAASATSAGSIGSGGFSFPVPTGGDSKPSSFSFGVAPAAGSDAGGASKSTGFSFGGASSATGFSFPSSTTSSGTGFTFPSSTKPAADSNVGEAAASTAPVATAGGSAYPPDTTSKPKPPTFGAASGSGYPPDTTSKPKPPAFGAASSGGYPPDTTSKPKPPAFGAAGSGGYPPDTTSKPKPPMFGQSTTSGTAASSSSFGFGSFGKSLFGSKPELSASTDSSAQTNTSASTVTPTKPKSLFGSSGATGKAPDTSSSPFGVVPKANSKSAFSFGSASASDSKEVAAKISSARPSFSFDSVSSTLDTTQDRVISEDQPPTKRTLKFGDTRAFDAKTSTAPSTTAKAKPIAAPAKVSKDFPSSRMEGQLWKLIVDFDKSLQRVNESSKNISSKDAEFSKKLLSQMDKLRAQISSLCDEINNLDESRDQVEKDVLFVIGSDGDVHEQLEYGREILDSFNDEGLKRTLEEQPLDQRSKETWDSLKNKLSEVEKCCVELDSHLSSSKIGADASGAVSSAHLFRVLKQTYDNSKMQYNKACKLAEHLEKLSLRGDHMRRTNGVSRISGEAEAHPTATKAEMVQMIVETEERSQDVRRNFLSLCNNVVTPRDVFSTPRRKLAPPTPSSSSNSPLRVKACSKLMPKTQLSVASPMSTAKQSSRSVSFKDTPVKSGSKLFSLAEAMTPKDEPAKLVQTPQPAKPSVGVGKAPQRPSLGAPATETKPTTTTAAKPNVFSFPKPKDTTSAFGAAAKEEDKKTTSTASSFGGFGVNSPAVKRKAVDEPAPAFSLGGKEAPASSAVNFGSKDTSPAQPPSTASATNYKALLEEFYKVHNPSKTGSVLEKALSTYKGREEDLFTRLFTMYVPDSTPEDVKKYLSGGPVPPKSESVASASKASAPASTAAKSPFGGFGASTTTPNSAAKPSPFGASPSAFSLGPAANTSSGFGGFGSTATNSTTTTTAPSPFGQPAVDYRQKLVEFYQKHNPNKLSSVDATLQKYKGNEEKLFQNLATKYKVNASPAVQPANPTATASPFGKPGAFSASSTSAGTTFGSASSVGFGAAKPAPSASPFGAAAAPASSPFGATSQPSAGFGSVSGSGFGGFQSTTATTPAFGAPSPFGATGGVNYREKLAAFYQQHNPAKLSSVDATLEKYKGREDHLFAMLEQKYVKKTPTAPAAGGFGVPSTTAFGGASGFGAPSALGAASAAPAFGSASNLGGAAQPAFGGAAGSGFGMASRMGGGGFGSAAPAASSGAATGTGFSAFGSQTPSFGGAPQQSGGFGAAANSGGFGSGFGGATTGGFGQPAAFSSSSFTQMR
ncbi:hypothetical protein PC118_g1643 [Phytophthora cactorum]|uniref:RanBP2-type domain-containing protein n=1 Tax=Phytophthora cactorum TaxID=29920 RepID=A0A8T1GM82_9STRA|nr:hypothetical protein PC112_g4481 [Phytophthora cactorum]KAG2865155.1 hypothetical protein PC113_g3936 [Phytophthora cactorum]KAG2997928.1 hypothetical protein PC118_g1643 [Phytophthora cactorum]KAG3189792.1 hypothetical protein C6341_g2096 [Phytophthora cactorum]